MKVSVQVVIEANGDAPPVVHEVSQLERDALQSDTLGLKLAEAKGLLQATQRVLVEEQVKVALERQVACPGCGARRRHKDARTIVVRTLFGRLRMRSPRWHHCSCQPQPKRIFSPLTELLPERTTPELRYLEAKFAGLVSYGLSAKLLAEVLPLGRTLHATAVRQHVQATAQQLENELGPEQAMFIDGCQRDWDELPRPDLPLTVGLDGGYVHARDQRSRREGWFEVIAGKSMPSEGPAKCFAFVQTYDAKPKRRLFELLRSQGMQPNQQISFLTDGGEDVRELPLYLNPQAEHLLDWFHLTMRLTVMGQMAKGLGGGDLTTEVTRQLERLKWFLWHGNVFRALQVIEDLEDDLDLEGEIGPERRKLRKAIAEFGGYLRANASWIPNYGERQRSGETISSAFTESTINQVVSKRMVKRQQMRWTLRGAHLLLQVRTRVLNDELADVFRRWYPQFDRRGNEEEFAA
jgi:hypothetical protein